MSIERMNMPAFHPEVPTAYEYIDGQCNTYPQTPLVPQTFGEELSYYETLVLMNKKINEIIDSINSGATLNVETTTTSTTADYATNAGTATSTNYANKSSVAKCAERASVAEYANEAGSAKKADRATIADNVTHSSTSDYATTAGSSSTATTATYATSAGYANSCNNADEADEADYANNAGKLNGHSASYYVANPMTTAGDIIVSGNGGVPQRLAKGENNQVLKIVNGNVAWGTGGGGGSPSTYIKSVTATGDTLTLLDQDNTATTFTPPSEYVKSASVSGNTLTMINKDGTSTVFAPSGSGGMSNPMNASGDIIYGGNGGAPQRLSKGTDGQILKLNNGLPSWKDDETPTTYLYGAAIQGNLLTLYQNDASPIEYLPTTMPNPMTASGDIIYGGNVVDGKATPTRLAKGTNGQYLKLVNNVPAWADGGGGEPETYLLGAVVQGNLLTLYPNDASPIEYLPTATFG